MARSGAFDRVAIEQLKQVVTWQREERPIKRYI